MEIEIDLPIVVRVDNVWSDLYDGEHNNEYANKACGHEVSFCAGIYCMMIS